MHDGRGILWRNLAAISFASPPPGGIRNIDLGFRSALREDITGLLSRRHVALLPRRSSQEQPEVQQAEQQQPRPDATAARQRLRRQLAGNRASSLPLQL
jgi:hypothetical protein